MVSHDSPPGPGFPAGHYSGFDQNPVAVPMGYPAPPYERPKVMVANRADGGIGFWLLRLYGF